MQIKTSKNKNIGALVALAVALFFPLAASAAQDKRPRPAAPPPENSRQGLDEKNGLIPLDRFLLKSEPRRGCGQGAGKTASAKGEWSLPSDGDTLADFTKPIAGPDVFSGIYVSPGVDGRVARVNAAGDPSFYFGDALNSVHQTTDASGAVTGVNFTDAWGNDLDVGLTPPTGPGSRYSYTGREKDGESGLMFYRARSYDPLTGRFTSRDPAWYPNLYTYAIDDPLNLTDPTGKWTWRLDELGRVIATSEKGDKLQDLKDQGYEKLPSSDTAGGNLPEKDTAFEAGVTVDVSGSLPAVVQKVLTRQQGLDMGEMAKNAKASPDTVERNKGKKFGTVSVDPEDWSQKKSQLSDLGAQNCYGFVATYWGAEVPEGIEPYDVIFAWGKDEKGVLGDPEKTLTPGNSEVVEVEGWRKEQRVCPAGGLEDFLTKGGETATPKLGDAVVFSGTFRQQGKPNRTGISHAGIVLGRSRDGTPYIIQKYNIGQPYAVTSANDQRLTRLFGTPKFYARKK